VKIIGIDLGTTNSVVAVVEGGEPTVITNPEGSRTTPSVVAFSDKGERLVGQVAKRQAITNPENTVYSIKRFMGRRFDEVQQEIKLVPYEVVEGLGGAVRVRVRGQELAPPEISAMILQKLKQAAEDYLGGGVTQAVVTVPAYFNDAQRQATKEAGRIAGLDVRRIINEPTAAALAYGFQKEGTADELIAVYDLGGGTFDVSLLERSEGLLEVRSTNGDTHLGGDDVDRVISQWVIGQFKDESGIDLAQDKMALQRVREAAEKAKIELSSVLETGVNLPFITADASGPKHLQTTLTRAKFESLSEELLSRTREPCLQAMRDASIEPQDIAHVLLVGGSTRIPLVQQIVRDLFGKEPSKSVNPDEVVAMGAAIQGAVLSGEVKDVLLLDVTPLTLGIETHGGVLTPLIPRNTTIPVKKSRNFSTVVDNQGTVEIHVLQGERKMAADNRSLGKFELVDLPAAPRGVPQIEVTFDIDANGIVNVSARDQATGSAQQITVSGTTGFSDIEIERMIRDAEEQGKHDEALAERVRVRNQAEALVYGVERQLRQRRAELDSGLVQRCEEALRGLQQAMAGGEPEELRSHMQPLEALLGELAQAASTQPEPAAATAEPGPAEAQAAGDGAPAQEAGDGAPAQEAGNGASAEGQAGEPAHGDGAPPQEAGDGASAEGQAGEAANETAAGPAAQEAGDGASAEGEGAPSDRQDGNGSA
jgi:molecular chaperone DnaK